ncbi:hypothetical protein K440DRAFT_618684 [Wilcoxina mikolae CBS 423.85]|nr:hypothetical protein K440DRAFT_618684 [Wilcoxina mikolae CBS 423.85]
MGATAKSSPDSLPPSPGGSNMAAPPSKPTPTRQRKKPGPKPKAKPPPQPQTLIVKLKAKAEFLANLKSSSTTTVAAVADGTSPQTTGGAGTPNGSSPGATSPQPSAEPSDPNLVPGGSAAGQKRKGIPGPKPGAKRVRQPGAPPLKPGRKKTKLDPSLPPGVLLNGLSHGAAKLGPKANTGAINDKLRALDRTGKPCKRWAKSGFVLKSFTGVQWVVPAWSAPRPPLDLANNNPDTTATNTSVPNSENVSVTEMSPSDEKMQTDVSAAPAPVIPTLALPPGITV